VGERAGGHIAGEIQSGIEDAAKRGASSLQNEQGGQMPPWIPRLLVLLVVTVLVILALLYAVRVLAGFIGALVVALFVSFALEPAVNWLAARGWKRSLATLLVLTASVAVVGVVIGTVIPLLIQQVQSLIRSIPAWLEEVNPFLERWFGFSFSGDSALSQSQDLLGMLTSWGADLAGNVMGMAGDALGALLQLLTVVLFSYYFVAQGPQLRRVLLSFFRPSRQQEILRTWDVAVDKTGGYLYSRLLLAVISAVFTFLMLTILRLPSALPLAIWVGVISQFIPTVGTYLAALIPLVLALIDSPVKALALLIFFVVYQQVENYLLAPRITSQTMDMHPAVAFGSVIAGTALFGAIGAFLAIPGAAILQAVVWTSVSRYEVVGDRFANRVAASRADSFVRRAASWVRRRRR